MKEEGRKQIQFKVKWENYEETTWEFFDPFVKDTTPMVEKYIMKNLAPSDEELAKRLNKK